MLLPRIILLYLCSISCFLANGQTFTYATYGLQIRLNNSNELYYIHSTGLFGFLEASIICEEYLNSTFLSYEKIDLTGEDTDVENVEIVCSDDESFSLDDCEITYENTMVDEVINITCMDAPRANAVAQLGDGTIAKLTRFGDRLAWGHVCLQGSNWDTGIARLACITLGYDFARFYEIRVEKKGVLGLYHFECGVGFSFNQCTYEISSNANGSCNSSYVIAIECCRGVLGCISLSTSTPTFTALTTTRTSTPTFTAPTTTRTSTYTPSTRSPDVTTTDIITKSLETTQTTPVLSTQATTSRYVPSSPFTTVLSHESNSWVFIGTGIAALWVVLLVFAIGVSVCTVACCCICFKRQTFKANLSQILYANPNTPGTLRTREEQDPPHNYYMLP